MRHTGNFNLEWGYLAPAPSFLRSVRLVVVAATIAATASAAVVFALVRQPAAEASIAARTLVQPVETAARGVPLAAEPPQTQSQHASTLDAEHAAGATRRESAPALAQAPISSSGGSGITSGSATPRAPIATAMAETSNGAAQPPQAHTAPEPAAAAAPGAAPVPKTPNKKARAAAQAKDQAASASRLRVASAQHAKPPPQPAAHNVARTSVASDDIGDFRDDDSLLAKTMGVTDHVVAATQRAVATIGVIPTWIGSIGNRLGD